MVWSGKSQYKTLDDAFRDLEKGIATAIGVKTSSHKRSARRKVAPKPAKSKKTDRPQISPLPKQVQKLDEIVEAIRRKEDVQVTRLTVVKKLCENPDAAGAFALFLARKAQVRAP